MRTIKIGDRSIDTLSLQCSLSGLILDGDFGAKTEEAVKKYQSSHGLVSDGIVGPSTWSCILSELPRGEIKDGDWLRVADNLGVKASILRALHDVETSGKSYWTSGYPAFLFEAHVFYRLLKAEGKNPESLMVSHPGIISRSWNRKLYGGGDKEVPRINEAFLISPKAALGSASWGAFQILGTNFKGSIFEGYKKMWTSEAKQLESLADFCNASGIVPWMKKLNFVKIAELYNGPSQAKNRYSEKLEAAYKKYENLWK